MKTVLVHINPDDGQTTRLNAAIALTRAFGGQLVCLQATPMSGFTMLADPFNASFDLPAIYQAVRERDETERLRIGERLAREAIGWEWLHVDEAAAGAIARAARLADIAVVSRPDPEERGLAGPLPIAADVALHARVPVLAVPVIDERFDCAGAALIAWNGSSEAAHAMRLALPLLARASAVHVVSVSEAAFEPDAEAAAAYLARHGISAKAQARPLDGGSVADALIASAAETKAAYIVHGAYGHSRLRETVLGGVTRDLLRTSPVPLLMAH